MKERLAVPFIPTLSNEVEDRSSFLLLQRVLTVCMFLLHYRQTPFLTDIALIEEEESESFPSFFSASSDLTLSLYMQMRVRLLTGFELTALIQERCECFVKPSVKATQFKRHVESSFSLHFDGLRLRDVSFVLSLFSNTLASIAFTSHNHTQLSLHSPHNHTQWSLHSPHPSHFCGYNEGLVLRVIVEWNQQWALALLESLVFALADATTPADCPPTYLFAIDRLLELQRGNGDDETPSPIHRGILSLLPPIMYSTQRALTRTESSVKLLYHSRGSSPAAISVSMTSWSLYASTTLCRLFDFYAVEKEAQERLLKRVATSKNRMMKWLWSEESRRFENTGAHRGVLRSTSLLPLVLDVGAIGNVRIDQYLDCLMGQRNVSSGVGMTCGDSVESGGKSFGGDSCFDGRDGDEQSVFVADNYLVLRTLFRRVIQKRTSSLYSVVIGRS